LTPRIRWTNLPEAIREHLLLRLTATGMASRLGAAGSATLRGEYRLPARGKWLVAVGALPPATALVVFRLL
jgi:hypothetical protein